MKRFYFSIILCLLTCNLMGQNINQLNTIITDCIESYLHKSIDSYSPNVKEACYICKDGFPLYYPFNSLSNAVFFSVDYFHSNNKRIKNELRKGHNALFLRIALDGSYVRITITERVVKLTGKRLYLGISDWKEYYYKYSEVFNRWELCEEKRGGI